MKRLANAHHRLMIALLVGVIAVPVSSTALFLHHDVVYESAETDDVRSSIRESREDIRERRRLYWRAIEEYQKRRKSDPDTAIKPNVNDRASIEKALRQNEVQEEEGEEQEPTVSSLTTRDLSAQDRHLLRRYTRAGTCPDSLKDFRIEGFYDLCLSLVGESAKREPVQGLLSNSAYLYRTIRPSAPDIPAFKLRVQMLKEAMDSGNRRDPGVLPGRPKHCVMNPNC